VIATAQQFPAARLGLLQPAGLLQDSQETRI
jgi:hypothetical protein